jgi:hypothetical protein
MSNELTNYNKNGSDGWSDAADEARERAIRGSIVHFADWNWTAGKEKRPLEKGSEFVAPATAAAWVKWNGGKPVEYRMREPGQFLPRRESLGDQDEAEWERGPDDKPRDPWTNTRFVYLIDAKTAEAFTYSTSSFGGRECVTTLGDQITRMRLAHPGAVPVVALDAAAMPTKYGRKSKPVLRVVG